MITFDSEKHTYTVEGIVRPSVTEILKPLYSDLRFVDQDLLEYKGALGTAVHKAVELEIKRRLDYATLESPVSEYFYQYTMWHSQSDWEPINAEVIVYSVMGYAGTLDIVARHNKTGQTAIIDLKCTAALSPAVALQTAGYAQAYAENQRIQAAGIRRFSLRLTPDKFVFTEYTDLTDIAVFLSLLNVSKWCKKYGKKIEFNEVKT